MGLKAIAAEQIYLALPEAWQFPEGLLGASAHTLAGCRAKWSKKLTRSHRGGPNRGRSCPPISNDGPIR
jgi:hypothetical protein